MGSNYKLISFVLLLLLIMAFVTACSFVFQNDNYSEQIILNLRCKDEISMSEIFTFDFDRAYVFDDPYISGEGFSKEYNLNLSISQVKTGVTEAIQRIVFVDKNGNFIYEFQCDVSEIMILDKKEKLIIYPETVIQKESFENNAQITVKFFGNLGSYS